MPRDKYHPHMVPFPLERRMRETGHTAPSVVAFLAPYKVDRATVMRWRKNNRVPYDVEPLLKRALLTVAPPDPKWSDFDLYRERMAARVTRKFMADYLNTSPTTIEEWESRRQVPFKRLPAIKKVIAMATASLTAKGKQS